MTTSANAGNYSGEKLQSGGARSSRGSSEFEQLIAQAQGGSRDALEEIIRSLQGYLLLIANEELDLRLRPKVGASDLVQSALAQAEQHLQQFRGRTKQTLLAWLRQILRNEMKAVRRKYMQAEKRSIRREAPEITGSVEDQRPSPRTQAIVHEEAIAVREALRRLPPDYRTVVVLRNWERLSFEEIGRRMNRSGEAAKKLWARAIGRLRGELNREDAEEHSK